MESRFIEKQATWGNPWDYPGEKFLLNLGRSVVQFTDAVARGGDKEILKEAADILNCTLACLHEIGVLDL